MEWPQVQLGELVSIRGGGTPSKQRADYWGGDIPWVSPKDMIDFDQSDSEDHITAAALAGSATQLVPRGTVLVVVRSGILARRLPVSIATRPVALNQDMKGIVADPALLEPRYLAFLLRAREREILDRCVKRGATVHSLRTEAISALSVPLPALSEQRRIVEILDQADHLRRLRTEANTKATRILPALFLRMFGDPATNPMGWESRSLGESTDHLTSGSRGWSRYTGRGHAFFVRTQDVLDGEIARDLLAVAPPPGAESHRTRLKEGDIVVTITGNVGKAAVVRDLSRELYVSQHVALIRPKPQVLISQYLVAYANLPLGDVPMLARFQYGQTKPGLGFRELQSARILLPPIELQQRFAQRAAEASVIRQPSKAAQRGLQSLWRSLVQRAFCGDLTSSWRGAHSEQLFRESEAQARALREVG